MFANTKHRAFSAKLKRCRMAAYSRCAAFFAHFAHYTHSPSLGWLRQRGLACLIVPLLAGVAFDALSRETAPAIPAVYLYSEPLYAEEHDDKALLLALSIEWPTVGALYNRHNNNNRDDSYSNKVEYLGYFNSDHCYAYLDAQLIEFRRFISSAHASERMCEDGFSGNFLNWATTSALDLLRLALTGGDRQHDRRDFTVLSRAYLPRDHCMWNSEYFPAKRLDPLGGDSGTAYFGAIPQSMIRDARNRPVWVGNTTDRFSMRAANTPSGNCSNYDDYTLGYNPDRRLTLRSDPKFFYARVEVCDQNGDGSLNDVRSYNLCQKYPNGNYKPIGAAQRYANHVRLAAFGYLMDNAQNASDGYFGGVLRVPMKYIGGKTFAPSGRTNTPETGNPRREWDEITGVLERNPDADPTYEYSGFINFVNKTGYNGIYKNFDPVGELYYEALRYLQGLEPTPAAIRGVNNALGRYRQLLRSNRTAEDDSVLNNFPVATSWTDPYEGFTGGDYACLKSNIFVVGDANFHDHANMHNGNISQNIPSIEYWWRVVKNFEEGTSIQYEDGQEVKRFTSNPNPENTDLNIWHHNIVGAAYWANTHDIRGRRWTNTNKQRLGLRVKTLVFDVNEKGEQDNKNHRRSKNPLYMAAKYGGFSTDSTRNVPFSTTGNPFYTDDGKKNNRIWSNAYGEPRNYSRASQNSIPKVLTTFDRIFRELSTSERSIAGGAIESRSLAKNMVKSVYQASFNRVDWTGDLLAFEVSASESNEVAVARRPLWSASTRLNQLQTPADTRNIFVGNAGASADPVAVPFTWESIEDSLKTQLNRAASHKDEDALGRKRLNYLRGDDTDEGELFRERRSLLGDIINSGVAYSGPPPDNVSSKGYSLFRREYSYRDPTVFVGANDGMLHAFNAGTGDELFAYIPSWLGPKLSLLTQPSYATFHQSYVDATPVVAEVQTGTGETAKDWKTVLVSGTGGGGQGVFALDVSDPLGFDASKVMWEFTHGDDPDMGNVVGKPQLLKFRTSKPDTSSPTYKWFAAVGNGVNSYVADSEESNFGSGRPALFLLDLDKPVGTPWLLGQNYYKISLPIDSSLSASTATGLVNFSAALGRDREVTQIYMGDLHGRLWKLDFSAYGSADWTLKKLSAFKKGTQPIPFFIAKDASGSVQPITMAPSITYGPTPASSYVLFGTGKLLEGPDSTSQKQQSFYMLYDNGTATADAHPVGASAISGRGRLREGTAAEPGINSKRGSITVPAFTAGRATSDGDLNQRSGWYFDFPSPGERMLGDTTIFGNKIIFASTSPLLPNTVEGAVCSSRIGSGNQYTLDIADGNGTSRLSNVGIMGDPFVVELSDSAEYLSQSDNTGRRIKTVKSQIIQQGSSGLLPAETVDKTVVTGRLSWRQINNYREFKKAP